MSQITTHILDTSVGKPAANVTVVLYAGANDEWNEVARGKTNKDGRIADWLPKDRLLETGACKLRFETEDYFDAQGIVTFYPFVEITFHVHASEHYHVPLLLNPFGYSTYRGS